jgi:hypothetical protein
MIERKLGVPPNGFWIPLFLPVDVAAAVKTTLW